jgi:hypothetical protein
MVFLCPVRACAIGTHLSDESWRKLLHEAHTEAQQGAKEFMLPRFPSEVCTDGGRAINAPDLDWPTTLRGEAAEIYLRWRRDLQPQGFHLAARVVDFPDRNSGRYRPVSGLGITIVIV